MKQQLLLGAAKLRLGGGEDAGEVEGPDLPAVAVRIDGRSQGDLVADLPSVQIRERPSGDRPGTHLDEGLALRLGQNQLRIHVEIAFGLDREVREEVLRVLIDAPEPARVGHRLHAGRRLDSGQIRIGQGLNQREARGGDEPIDPDDALRRVERHPHGVQHAEERKGRRYGKQRQQCARLLAHECGEEEGEVFHRERSLRPPATSLLPPADRAVEARMRIAGNLSSERKHA